MAASSSSTTTPVVASAYNQWTQLPLNPLIHDSPSALADTNEFTPQSAYQQGSIRQPPASFGMNDFSSYLAYQTRGLPHPSYATHPQIATGVYRPENRARAASAPYPLHLSQMYGHSPVPDASAFPLHSGIRPVYKQTEQPYQHIAAQDLPGTTGMLENQQRIRSDSIMSPMVYPPFPRPDDTNALSQQYVNRMVNPRIHGVQYLDRSMLYGQPNEASHGSQQP